MVCHGIPDNYELQDGDIVRVDAVAGTIDVLSDDVTARTPVCADLTANQHGTGRGLFGMFRQTVCGADSGASIFGGSA